VVAADALVVELRRRAGDARSGARLGEGVVNQTRGIDDGRFGRERVRLLVLLTRAAQVDADEARELPELLAKPVEAAVVEDGDADRRQAQPFRDLGNPLRLGLVEPSSTATIARLSMPATSSSARTERRPSSGAVASWQSTIASALRRTPSSARPPPRSSVAPSIRPGISTSCTGTPWIRVTAGTGRVVVNA
jgi:hypothetical protein